MTQTLPKITPAQIAKLKKALPTMPDEQKRRALELLARYHKEKSKFTAQNSFLDFVLAVYPGYKIGPHHRKLAEIFEDALVQMYKVTQQPTISTTYQTIPFSTITQ